MIEKNYTIDEILSAVNEIQKDKKDRKPVNFKNSKDQIDYTAVPKNTLKLIEEAEKLKNI
jgi:hypothetical protein